MFKKLLEYNWQVFRYSLTPAKVLGLLVYGVLLVLIFSQVIGTVYLIVSLQSVELNSMFKWYTPERGRFITLAFANILWLAQFFFTNIKLLQLDKNRKLLSKGFPLHKLARYLAILAIFHPLNLLFNFTWFVFLMMQLGNFYYVPLALCLVIANFALIFSVKFRVLTVIKSYQKWLLILVISILIIVSGSFNDIITGDFFTQIERYLSSFNLLGSLLPGGLLVGVTFLAPSLIVHTAVIIFCGFLIYFLHRDHIKNTCRGLQAQASDNTHSPTTGKLRSWLCDQVGHHAGKYLYYVITHPYNKIQAFIFLMFPIIYVPFMISRMDELGVMKFLVLFFFMYAPMGFQLIFMGNMFGYEYREMLREIQFPVSVKDQIKERLQGALIIPLSLLIIISGAEVVILWGRENLLSILLGNIFIFEAFMALFLWSTFNHIKKVKWVSFSFTQPVISQPVAILCGFLMLVLSAFVYIEYGSFELYKQLLLILVVIIFGFWIYRYISNIEEAFASKIIPRLWNEL